MRRTARWAIACWAMAACSASAALLPSRTQVDRWLAPLGANDRFDARKGIDWGVMPGPFYTPELSFGVGVALVGLYRPTGTGAQTQNSTLALSGYAGLRGAFGLTFRNDTFLADDHWRLFVDGALSHTPTWDWGAGFRAGENNHNKQQYTARTIALRPDLFWRVTRHGWLGAGAAYASRHASQRHNRQRGSLTRERDGLAVQDVGVSLSLRRDTRDWIANPQRGGLLALRYTRFMPPIGSDTRYTRLDGRFVRYHALDDSNVLAWEINGVFTQGEVPWSSQPSLGNDRHLRGYYDGRYRDRNTLSSQLEWRRRLAWRHGVVAWVGGGTMAAHPQGLNGSRWLPSVGAGYRFAFKPRMNVRLDYGIGKASSGFYFQVGEAF
ncbi:BamA/TamA family outer membrane protein [Pantoea sp. 1.19]|uniref:BamA/TamA family outer membrane protein n=1 Tax=Pantoea sp. 1.19 TaxID=1925589 RepID=UPI000948E25F|nr:BamA/TamA family outer membrane protein [Pantoea sp. 1.19]